MKTRLISFGFEIEGEFFPSIENLASKKTFKIETDGSLRSNENTPKTHKLFELQSRVFNVKEISAAKKVMDITRITGKYRPNASAGFHIHMGFTPQIPPECYSVEFSKYFLSEMKKHYPEEYETRKNIMYCKPNNELEENAIDNIRYKAVNFCALKEHKTIEIRIFPSNTTKKMYDYLLWTIRTTKKFLSFTLETRYKINLNEEEKGNEKKTHDHLKKQKINPFRTFVNLKNV